MTSPRIGDPPLHPRRVFRSAHHCARRRQYDKVRNFYENDRDGNPHHAVLLCLDGYAACGFRRLRTVHHRRRYRRHRHGSERRRRAQCRCEYEESRHWGKSDEGGRFLITHLAPGVYSVEITATGFAAYKATSITVEVGRTTTIDATLG